jgi:hypothetical protein
MGEVFLPIAGVPVLVFESHDTLPLANVVREGAFVPRRATEDERTLAVHFSLPELAIVQLAICEVDSALPVSKVVFELALVPRPGCPSVYPFSIAFVAEELALVRVAGFERLLSLAMLFPVKKLPVIRAHDLALCAHDHHLAAAVWPAVGILLTVVADLLRALHRRGTLPHRRA